MRRQFLTRVAGFALLPAMSACAVAEPRENRIGMVVALERKLLRMTGGPAAATAWRTDEVATLDATIQYAAWHPARALLYVVTSDADTPGRRTPARHALTTLRLQKTGAAIAGKPRPLPGFANHIAVHPDGSTLFLACHAPSMLLAIAVDENGEPGAMLAQFGADVVGEFAHQTAVAPGGDAVVVCARGNDAREGHVEERGALTAFSIRDGRPVHRASLTFGAGIGPRNLDFHPSRPMAYVAMERGNRLAAMQWNGNGFDAAPHALIDTLAEPARQRPRQRAGAVRVHPNGRHVYVANRADRIRREAGTRVFAGGENNIVVCAIDPVSGVPVAVQHIDTGGIEPRSMAIDKAGSILAVGNQIAFSGTMDGLAREVPAGVVLFSIGADGRLALLHRQALDGDGLRWLDFDRT